MTTELIIALAGIVGLGLTMVTVVAQASNKFGALTEAVQALTRELGLVRRDLEKVQESGRQADTDNRERFEELSQRIATLEGARR